MITEKDPYKAKEDIMVEQVMQILYGLSGPAQILLGLSTACLLLAGAKHWTAYRTPADRPLLDSSFRLTTLAFQYLALVMLTGFGFSATCWDPNGPLNTPVDGLAAVFIIIPAGIAAIIFSVQSLSLEGLDRIRPATKAVWSMWILLLTSLLVVLRHVC